MGNKVNSGKRWKAARRKHLLKNVENIARKRLANKQIATQELDDTVSRLDLDSTAEKPSSSIIPNILQGNQMEIQEEDSPTTEKPSSLIELDVNLHQELNQTPCFEAERGTEELSIGRRIVNISHFFKSLQEISSHGPLDCGLKSIEIVSERLTDTPPLCLGCYCPVENTLCSQCGWPICSPECEASPQHAGECAVFAAAKVRFLPVEDWTASATQLDCITPLRILLAKENDPDRWQKELEPMETHTEERKKRPTWEADQVNVVDFLVDRCKLGRRFDKELVQKVCGILEVNSVEVPSRVGYSVRAIYPRLAIAAHDCIPNIVHTILQNDYQVIVRAAVPIKSGEPLHLCYTHALSQTIMRREFLLESKFFNCECQRCADPTELGTHLSTLKCSKCDSGVLLSSNPLDVDAQWICTDKKCEFKTSGAAMRKMLSVVQAEIEQLDYLEPGPQTVQQREALLNKYKSVFHPRHALILSVKHSLAQLYGRVEEYIIEELPDIILERKAEFCRLVLNTLDVITPGETRMRGMMLYELHVPVMFLARSEFAAGLIDTDKLKERLQEPIRLLDEAAKILLREDPQSPEGITGQIAYQAMEQLKASVEAL